MLKTRVYQASMEAGQRLFLNNITGKQIGYWDNRGFMRQTSYDALHRPTALTVTDSNSNTFIAEQTLLGESRKVGFRLSQTLRIQ